MQIGPYQFDSPLILAPMAGVTDQTFRKLCRSLGADLAVSEMVKAHQYSSTSLAQSVRSRLEDEPGPRSVQIIGNDPAQMAAAAKLNVDQGADIIDINMGCPAKKVCKKACGLSTAGTPRSGQEDSGIGSGSR